MKLDLLAFAAHPDDVELTCAGTLLKYIALGKKAGIIDLTQGELGTRGDAATRLKEARESASLLSVSVRQNLGFADGFFENNKEHRLEIVKIIRKFRPEIILANAVEDRHPDHGKAAQLVEDSCFLSGLLKLETTFEEVKQEPWRPKALYHYIQDRYIRPHFVVDISEFMEQKMKSVLTFRSQFYNPDSKEPDSYISSKEFLDSLYSRAAEYGKSIHAKYAEGFTTSKIIGVEDLFSLR